MEDITVNREPFVKLRPAFKDYLWGGTKLKALYGAADEIVAEAWLLSAHPDGPSVVAEGKYTGMAFADYLKTEGMPESFPVLVKLIDSAQKLSVQVHPDNAYARANENDSGKSEMWLVLEADPDAYLYAGFSRDVTKEEVRRRVEDGTIEEVLNRLPTQAGDMIYIPAGTVHAIGSGNLILEVQQSSNATLPIVRLQAPRGGRQSPSPACGQGAGRARLPKSRSRYADARQAEPAMPLFYRGTAHGGRRFHPADAGRALRRRCVHRRRRHTQTPGACKPPCVAATAYTCRRAHPPRNSRAT